MLVLRRGEALMRTIQRSESQPRTDAFTIGQLAARTGIGAKTIRYYESIGLLPRPPRGANRYRRYGVADVNRMCLLRDIRYLGVPLAVAKPLLVGASEARCTDVRREVLALVEQRLQALDQEIAELQQLRSDVEGYQRRLAACHAETSEMSEAFSECSDMSCIALSGEEKVGDNEDGLRRNV